MNTNRAKPMQIMKRTVGVISLTACMFYRLNANSRLKSKIILGISLNCFAT